jgi:hypothetical protein
MASSKLTIPRLWWGVILVILVVAAVSVVFMTRMKAAAGESAIGPDTVVYRYRFGGEVISHYLSGVATVTEYRRPDVVDAVVFNLKDGNDYVLNADLLVDYRLSADTTIEKLQALNKLFYRYDPYLQGEKQGWHKEWVDAEYMKWVGRLPTDAEWLEILNELTRGVEHHQMERWIQYSPPAILHFIETEFSEAAGRAPTEAEIKPFYDRLLAGENYDEISKDMHAGLVR